MRQDPTGTSVGGDDFVPGEDRGAPLAGTGPTEAPDSGPPDNYPPTGAIDDAVAGEGGDQAGNPQNADVEAGESVDNHDAVAAIDAPTPAAGERSE